MIRFDLSVNSTLLILYFQCKSKTLGIWLIKTSSKPSGSIKIWSLSITNLPSKNVVNEERLIRGKKVALIRDRESLQINEQKAFKYLLLIFKN